MSDEQDSSERVGRAIDRAVTVDVADLVDEAQLMARKKVRATLVDAFTEHLLGLAEAELRRRSAHLDAGAMQAAQESPEPPNQAREQQSFVCYVYGVVDGKTALTPGVTGLDDSHEVFLVHGESAAAVTSLVSSNEFGEEALREHLNDLSWLERRARRHEQVLDRVREQTTLVPMRLCTIYRDERSVREMLAREHEFLADALRRLRGRTEWGVKLYVVSDPSEAIEQAPSEAQAPDEMTGAGSSYLMRKQLQAGRREAAQALVEERCELAHSEIAQMAVEAKLNPVQPPELTGREEPMVFNGVYLVDDAALESFSSAVSALERDLAADGLALELTGPWTPYNFVNSPIEGR